MALEARIEGAATLHKVAAHMRAEGQKDLSRQMGRALGRAAEPMKVSIRREAGEVMPSSGGYRAVFDKALKFSVGQRVGQQSATVKLTTTAQGKKDKRDIRSLNNGALRHPLFKNRKRWYTTSIRAGFHTRGTEQAMEESQRELTKVIEEYASRLAP